MMNKLLSVIERQYINVNDNTITQPERDITNLQGFKEIEALFKYDEDLKNLPIGEFFKHNYKENMRTLYGNGGWRARPLSLEEEVNYDEDDYEELQGKQVQRIAPFTILYKISADNSKVVIYGRA